MIDKQDKKIQRGDAMSILLLGFDTESAKPADNKTDVDERIRESLSAVSLITTKDIKTTPNYYAKIMDFCLVL